MCRAVHVRERKANMSCRMSVRLPSQRDHRKFLEHSFAANDLSKSLSITRAMR
jgi:hypothetical protein